MNDINLHIEQSDFSEELARNLTCLLEVATGSSEHFGEVMRFAKSTNWYGGKTQILQEKLSNVTHPTLYQLLDKYSANAKMQVRIGEKVISFPQELITGNIQGRFEDVFVKFDPNVSYTKEIFGYPPEYHKICSELEDVQRSKSKMAGRRLFNGKNLRLSDLKVVETGDKLQIQTFHQPVYYFNYIATNCSPDEPVRDDGTTLRNLIHREGRLHPLDKSIMSNHICVNILVLSKNNKLILQHRGRKVFIRQAEACSSASGAIDVIDVSWDLSKAHPILMGVYREVQEEIGLDDRKIADIVFLGAIREFLRGGMPEFFFAAKTDLEQHEIIRTAKDSGKNLDKWEWSDIPILSSIDPSPQGANHSFGVLLAEYIDMLLKLEQPASLPLLTNIILLAKFKSRNPGML